MNLSHAVHLAGGIWTLNSFQSDGMVQGGKSANACWPQAFLHLPPLLT